MWSGARSLRSAMNMSTDQPTAVTPAATASADATGVNWAVMTKVSRPTASRSTHAMRSVPLSGPRSGRAVVIESSGCACAVGQVASTRVSMQFPPKSTPRLWFPNADSGLDGRVNDDTEEPP